MSRADFASHWSVLEVTCGAGAAGEGWAGFDFFVPCAASAFFDGRSLLARERSGNKMSENMTRDRTIVPPFRKKRTIISSFDIENKNRAGFLFITNPHPFFNRTRDHEGRGGLLRMTCISFHYALELRPESG